MTAGSGRDCVWGTQLVERPYSVSFLLPFSLSHFTFLSSFLFSHSNFFTLFSCDESAVTIMVVLPLAEAHIRNDDNEEVIHVTTFPLPDRWETCTELLDSKNQEFLTRYHIASFEKQTKKQTGKEIKSDVDSKANRQQQQRDGVTALTPRRVFALHSNTHVYELSLGKDEASRPASTSTSTSTSHEMVLLRLHFGSRGNYCT